ncbi:MAG TPA: CHAT domain-containing protein, partial [Niabella sp.]|nr:CHAT domain-containing protein [Niabella sp.]
LLDYINYTFDALDENPALVNKADSIFSNIWRKPISYDEKLGYYQLQINIGYHLLQSRQVRASTSWYEKALLFYEENKTDSLLAAEMEPEEYIGKPLGNNYTRIGDFSKAIAVQHQVIKSAIKKNRREMLPGLYANLATTYFYMRDYPEVHNIINLGIGSLQNNSQGVAALLYNLKTEVYLETGRIDSAAHWNRKALSAPLSDHTAWHQAALTNNARILNKQHKYSEALVRLQSAWEIAGASSVTDKAGLSNEIAVNLFKLNQPILSKAWFEQTLAFFKTDSLNLYPDYNVTTAMFGLALCYEVQQQTDSSSYWSTQAVLNDYYTQQLIDPWLYSKSNIYSNEQQTNDAIALHHYWFETTHDDDFLWKALWMTELSKGRKLMYEQQRAKNWKTEETLNNADLSELRNDYLLLAQAASADEKTTIKERIARQEYQLSLKGSRFSQSLSAPSFNTFKVQVNKSRETNNLISYHYTNKGLYIIKANRSGLSSFVDSSTGNLQDIADFTKKYFYSGPQAFGNNPGTYFKAAHAIFRKYLPGETGKEGDYIISPSGRLHELPFEALSTDEKGSAYFGVAHAVSYLFSLIQLTDPVKAQPAAIHVFSFENGHLGFPALPSTKKEANYLQGRFNCTYSSAAATTDSIFYRSLGAHNIIHLASHAVAGDSTEQPFIVLQKRLYLGQLQFNIANSPLVVLSACETGKGASQHNEGIISLGRAFISSGVDGALSTRWEVD